MEAQSLAAPPQRWSLHDAIDVALPVALTLAGFFQRGGAALWLGSLAFSFAALAGPVLGGAGLVTLLAGRFGERIQGVRRKPAPIGREAFETARAMYVAACLMAWPVSLWRLGHPIGLTWSLGERGAGLGGVLLQTFAGVMIIDAWLYWKHRLLHTQALFGFHKGHHAFRDPTPFAGFAVGPVEAVLTFWPVLLLCIPQATHWAPLYFGLVVGFVNLNFYLHCGVTIGWAERALGALHVNTSAFHNVHHSRANTHYGEALTLWDEVCGTADR